MASKYYKCQFCNYMNSDKKKLGEHYQTKHKDLIPPDMDGYRWFYYTLTGKDRGSCVMCKSETEFNRGSMKYNRFCTDPKCKAEYREIFKDRMIAAGKLERMKDPNVQKEMLANRKISGVYLWSDNIHKFQYTGSYEKDFLRLLDRELHWSPDDLFAPSPYVHVYEYKGEPHLYIPDFFIPSLNIEVEIKDDGSARNINQDSRNKDVIKDTIMRNSNLTDYIKIVNKNYEQFKKLIKESA